MVPERRWNSAGVLRVILCGKHKQIHTVLSVSCTSKCALDEDAEYAGSRAAVAEGLPTWCTGTRRNLNQILTRAGVVSEGRVIGSLLLVAQQSDSLATQN